MKSKQKIKLLEDYINYAEQNRKFELYKNLDHERMLQNQVNDLQNQLKEVQQKLYTAEDLKRRADEYCDRRREERNRLIAVLWPGEDKRFVGTDMDTIIEEVKKLKESA